MPDLSSFLARIPDDLKPLAALGVGAVMLVFLVMFHGAGLHLILVLRRRRERRLRLDRPHLVAAFLLFGWSIFLLLTLHIVEFMMWAYTLTYLGLIARGYDAIYFVRTPTPRSVTEVSTSNRIGGLSVLSSEFRDCSPSPGPPAHSSIWCHRRGDSSID